MIAAGIAAGATVVGSVAVLCGFLVLLRTRDVPFSVGVLLDLLLAAGLLRLTANAGWPQVATAAALVVLRKLLTTALREATVHASRR